MNRSPLVLVFSDVHMGIAVRGLLTVALVLGASAVRGQPAIDFYFTNDAVLRDGAAAAAQWPRACVAGGKFADVAGEYAPDPQMGLGERKAQAAKFDREAFVRIATGAWQKASAALPHGALRVCIDLARADDSFTRQIMGGVSAVTAGSGRIILRIHPDADWQAALPYAVAHEMHHNYWAGHHFDRDKPFTLADYLVLEGRADYFAQTLFTSTAPWTAALDATEYTTIWRTLSKELGTTDWNTLRAAMFGSPQAGLPMWAGYRVGYRLVSERMGRAPTWTYAR